MSVEPIPASLPWDAADDLEDALSLAGQSWRLRAACRGLDTSLFFPPVGRGGQASVAAAKRICGSCPVRVACLEHALCIAPSYDHGIFGGTTRGERLALRRKGAQ